MRVKHSWMHDLTEWIFLKCVVVYATKPVLVFVCVYSQCALCRFKYSQSHITHRLNTTPVISLNKVMISVSFWSRNTKANEDFSFECSVDQSALDHFIQISCYSGPYSLYYILRSQMIFLVIQIYFRSKQWITSYISTDKVAIMKIGILLSE